MITIQAIPQNDEDLHKMVRDAITSKKIRSFKLAKVKGGVKIRHDKFLGSISLSRRPGFLEATLRCNNRDREWQLLESFVGRLVYHLRGSIAAINIQLH